MMRRDRPQAGVDLEQLVQNLWGQNVERIRMDVIKVKKIMRLPEPCADRCAGGLRDMAM